MEGMINSYPQSVVDALNKDYAVPSITALDSLDRISGAIHAIEMLPFKEQYIIKQHYANRKSMEKIGVELHLTRQRISVLHKKAMQRLIHPNISIYLYNGLKGAEEILQRANTVPFFPYEDNEPYLSVDVLPDYIDKLKLSPRTYNALMRNGITTIGEVLSMSEKDLMRLKSFGAKAYSELMSISGGLMSEYAKSYRNHSDLFEKIDNSDAFTQKEKETIKGAFSELYLLKKEKESV